MKKLAADLIDAFRGQPLTLALIVINLIFVGLAIFLLSNVANGLERRDAIINDLIKICGAKL